MDTVDGVLVVLQPYKNVSYYFPREWILSALPSSILASALVDDLKARAIFIPNPNVTPDVMQLLVDYSEGREPLRHNPNLTLAHRYLNIPELLYYADPYYDLIPNRSDGAAEENKEFIRQIINEDRVWPFGYLVGKGYTPINDDLITAARSGATNIVRSLLADPRIDPAAESNAALREAAGNGRLEVVRLLLGDLRVDPTVWHNSPLREAARNGQLEIIRFLLGNPRVDPADLNNAPLREAAANGHLEVVSLLLTDPRVDPTALGNRPLIEAARNGHLGVVRLLLADPRVDPTDLGNRALREAAANGHLEVVRLLLTDPRVRQTLAPELLAKYQSMVQ